MKEGEETMEKDRYMTTYHCRLTPEAKKALIKQATDEFKTANKIVEDAIYIYLALSEEARKMMVEEGRKKAKSS